MRLKAHAVSDIGLIRTNNEDAWFSSVQEALFLVADGLGGHQAGEIASKEAIDKFREVFFHQKKSTVPLLSELSESKETHPIFAFMRSAVIETNSALFDMSLSHGLLKGMGTTLLALYVSDQTAFICHVGDSRLYHYRAGKKIEQLTHDHLIYYPASKVLPKEKELYQRQKGYLTKAIGTQPHIEPDLFAIPVKDGDLLLMCSDGLSDMVSEADIDSTLKLPLTVEQKVRMLVSLAKENGGADNITVLLVEIVSSE